MAQCEISCMSCTCVIFITFLTLKRIITKTWTPGQLSSSFPSFDFLHPKFLLFCEIHIISSVTLMLNKLLLLDTMAIFLTSATIASFCVPHSAPYSNYFTCTWIQDSERCLFSTVSNFTVGFINPQLSFPIFIHSYTES